MSDRTAAAVDVHAHVISLLQEVTTYEADPRGRLSEDELAVGPKQERRRTPVWMIVPAGSVVPCDSQEMSLGTEKIRSSMPLFCTTLPFLVPVIVSFEGSGIEAAETMQGPTRQALSGPLPKHHWL